MGAKEQSYNKLSDYPSLLVSIPVAVVRKVGILAASLYSKWGFSVICSKQRSPLPNSIAEILQQAEIEIF